jgi:hypothetical protein
MFGGPLGNEAGQNFWKINLFMSRLNKTRNLHAEE